MYTDWFKLSKLPFRLRPDPEFLYLAGEGARAQEALRAAVAKRHGMVCLVGESGVGKTTLLHAIAGESAGSAAVARIQQPNLTAPELIASLAEQFGLPAQEGARHDAAARLTRFVAEESAHGRPVLILVDEAHRCDAALLRELLHLAARPPAPLVIMAGEAQLPAMLTALAAEGGSSPAVATVQLPRLGAMQIGSYVQHRLEIAGSGARVLFEPECMAEILRYTGGTPQLINTLCDSAMMLAEAHNVQRVGIVELRDATQELNWVEFSARPTAAAAVAPHAAPTESAVPAPRAGAPELEVQYRGQPIARLALAPGRLVVGRAEDAGLRLDSAYVSRHHCQLVTTADHTVIEDLDSRNGFLVNGTATRAHRLQPHDQVAIGEHTLTFVKAPLPRPR